MDLIVWNCIDVCSFLIQIKNIFCGHGSTAWDAPASSIMAACDKLLKSCQTANEWNFFFFSVKEITDIEKLKKIIEFSEKLQKMMIDSTFFTNLFSVESLASTSAAVLFKILRSSDPKMWSSVT